MKLQEYKSQFQEDTGINERIVGKKLSILLSQYYNPNIESPEYIVKAIFEGLKNFLNDNKVENFKPYLKLLRSELINQSKNF